MEDKLEKKLKAFLPYIIIIGVVYLIVPALLFINSDAIAYIILIGVLPLTTLLCCAHYSMNKENDFLLCLLAPIFFLPAMFLYPIARGSEGALLRAFIYLIAYFLCGYLGLTVGDILANRTKSEKQDDDDAPRPARRSARRSADRPAERHAAGTRATRVDVDVDETPRFTTSDPYEDRSLDTSTTSDDIEAILNEIHQRRSGE